MELKMNELTTKYIIMARIAVSLHNKGFLASATLGLEYACMGVQFEGEVVEHIFDQEVTETELLDWWAMIEGGK